jgi:hypothetical protein
MILLRPASDARGARGQAALLNSTGWLRPGASGPILLGVPRLAPKDQESTIRAMRQEGANAFALCPWVPSDSEALSPAFSAATFPPRP